MAFDTRGGVQQNISSLLSKITHPDPDIRYMSVNDVLAILDNPSSAFLVGDSYAASKVVDGLLRALADTHGEVQNQALKWFGIESV